MKAPILVLIGILTLFFSTYGATSSGDDDDKKPDKVSINLFPLVECGNQDFDNRPNRCDVNGVEMTSSCSVIAPGQCQYTHCSGATTLITETNCCCVTWNGCEPPAGYVAICLGGTTSLVSDEENPGGIPPPVIGEADNTGGDDDNSTCMVGLVLPLMLLLGLWYFHGGRTGKVSAEPPSEKG